MRSPTGAVPLPDLGARLASALGRKPVSWRTPQTGLSPAKRFVVGFADGSSAFVKAAVDTQTASWLRTEQAILAGGAAWTFVPRVVAWIDDADWPVLVTEDLGGAYWPADRFPVVWQPGQIDRLRATLRRVGKHAPPVPLPDAADGFELQWPLLVRDRDVFLALGLCSAAWLDEAVDALRDAEVRLALAGDSLVHGDVRSDNLCFLGERVVLVDWGGALRGNPEYDLAWALSTLPLEGGPDPFDVLPGGGSWAAHIAGRSAWRACCDATAPPWLRRVLRKITAICLDWAARSLDLPPRVGVDWRAIS